MAKSPARERWTFTVELPDGLPHPGRFVARLLKHLLRTWGVQVLAVRDEPACPPTTMAQDATGAGLPPRAGRATGARPGAR
jgi:hypothetical protein